MTPLPTHTSRLLLRPPTPEDADALFSIYGDPATNLYNPAGTYANLEQAIASLTRWRSHWAEHGFGQWAVTLASAPSEVIGFGGLLYRAYGDSLKPNLGFRFSPAAWGRGYATELGRAGLQLAFGPLALPAVYALVRSANTGSLRVVAKLGMQAIGEQADEHGRGMHNVFQVLRPGD